MVKYSRRVHPITRSAPKKRIAIIGTVGIPPRYGGFETFVNQLINYLTKEFRFFVFCSKYSYKSHTKIYKNVTRIFLPFKANGYQSVKYDVVSIIYSLFKTDVLFILGISGCVVLPIIKIVSTKKIIVSVDGLDPKREKWSWIAKKFLEISEWCAVKFADEIISDNKEIKTYIDDKYKEDSRFILYGADHSTIIRPTEDDINQFLFLKDDYAVAIARIEKENHCDIILEAFSENTNLKLVFVGTWDGNEYSRRLFNKYASKKNIVLIDPIYDRYKINLIRSNAKIFIHGNSAGGTNPGLLEAMQVGLPIIAYDVIFNRNVTLGDALFYENAIQLSNHVSKYCNDDELAVRNGVAVKRTAKDNYGWVKIAKEYKELFNS